MHPAAWALLTAICGAFAPGADAFEFAPPDFLVDPAISRSAYGVTYDYRGRDEHPHAALQITLVELPREIRTAAADPPRDCLGLFMAEVRKHAPDLLIHPVGEPLAVGRLGLQQARWMGRIGRHDMTGVTACGVDGERYVSVNFQDTPQGAVVSFPILRRSLRALSP